MLLPGDSLRRDLLYWKMNVRRHQKPDRWPEKRRIILLCWLKKAWIQYTGVQKYATPQETVIYLSQQRENSGRVISVRVILVSLATEVTFQRREHYLPAALIELITSWKRERQRRQLDAIIAGGSSSRLLNSLVPLRRNNSLKIPMALEVSLEDQHLFALIVPWLGNQLHCVKTCVSGCSMIIKSQISE